MEIYGADIEEPYNEALRPHLYQHVYLPPLYREGNVSSLNLESLFKSSSSIVCDINNKSKYVPAKRKDSGDFYNQSVHEVNYHKIIIERTNRNKGCMCTLQPINERAEKVTNTESKFKKDTENEPVVELKNIYTVTCSKFKDVENQTSKPCMCGLSTVVQTDNNDNSDENGSNSNSSEGNKCGKKKCKRDRSTSPVVTKNTKPEVYKACKKRKSSSSSSSKEIKVCGPSNFEELLQLSEKEKKHTQARQKLSCSCQTYDVGAASNREVQVQEKNIICEQNQPQVIVKPCNKERKKKKKKKPTGFDNKSTESSSCWCERRKKKCFCFGKKHNKEISKDDLEKSIQTRNICISHKCHQVSHDEQVICDSTLNVIDNKEHGDQAKSTPLCDKCGKTPNEHCKKCCTSYTKNKITLPPKCALTSDQADTLKTLIKMEAKQNYRQVNIILQELNEQKSEIKRLLELYQGLSKNVSGNKLDKCSNRGSNHGIMRKRSFLDDYPQRTHTVNICEGCGLHFYEPPVESDKSSPQGDGEKVVNAKSTKTSVENVDSNKQIKKTGNGKKSKTSTEKLKSEAPKIVRKDTVPEVPVKTKVEFETKGENDTKTESLLTLYMDESEAKGSEASELREKKTEQTPEHVENTNSEKKLTECKSKSKAFVNWCKKSFMSVKEKESKHLKECNKYLKNKIKECQETYKTRPKKSIFAYFLQYFKISLKVSFKNILLKSLHGNTGH